MALHLLFLMLFLYSSGAERHAPLDCGNFKIQYPFGMERGCIMHDWQEIECRQNGTVPWLKKASLEVLNIEPVSYSEENNISVLSSSSGLIQVKLLIVPLTSNCTTRNKTNNNQAEAEAILRMNNLRGSSLFYYADNVFVVLGCDQFVIINDGNSSLLRGCKHHCSKGRRSFSRYSDCLGTDGCCQSDLLPLQELRVHFFKGTQEEDGQEYCSYVFLANWMWLELEMQRQGGSADLFSIVSQGYIPGI